MSEQNPTQKAQPAEDEALPKIMNPVCPHCGADPAEITGLKVQTQDGTVLLVHYCNNRGCRKIYAVQAIQIPAAPAPAIARPGGWSS